MKSNNLNVFQGKSSILDFLDPDKSPPTPLVELSSELNHFRSQNVRIFAKLHNMLPLGNIKMLAARNMLEKGFESGKLKNTNSLIEYSSGNTILSLAIIARQMGIKNIKSLISHEPFESRINLIHFDWQKSIDQLEEVGIEESYTESLTLCRNGLLVGPSSGFTFAGLKKFLEKQITSNNLDKFKNKDGEIIAVFACYDGPFQYLSEYFDYVDKKEFSPIESEELLVYKKGQQSKI